MDKGNVAIGPSHPDYNQAYWDAMREKNRKSMRAYEHRLLDRHQRLLREILARQPFLPKDLKQQAQTLLKCGD